MIHYGIDTTYTIAISERDFYRDMSQNNKPPTPSSVTPFKNVHLIKMKFDEAPSFETHDMDIENGSNLCASLFLARWRSTVLPNQTEDAKHLLILGEHSESAFKIG